MKLHRIAFAASLTATMLAATTLSMAQNIALVNGKAVPVSRFLAAKSQLDKKQALPPGMDEKIKEELVLREIFTQEAERKGFTKSADFRNQMELARQSILMQILFLDFEQKNSTTEAQASEEYKKIKAMLPDKEYRARHILVEKEEEATAIIAKLNAGSKFEDLAKDSSKDPGSAQNGGDLDWASPDNYVPEFSSALTKLEKGQMTTAPVKSQFGYHIIKLEDVRATQGLPPFEEVKEQIIQRANQGKLAQYQEELRVKAKTDFKFAQ